MHAFLFPLLSVNYFSFGCAEQVRCIYCEHNNRNRIVHPAVSGFHGRDNFFDLFYGSDRYTYRNNKPIWRDNMDWVEELYDDAMYCNFVPADEKDADDLICREFLG
jgi:hypothetical protein